MSLAQIEIGAPVNLQQYFSDSPTPRWLLSSGAPGLALDRTVLLDITTQAEPAPNYVDTIDSILANVQMHVSGRSPLSNNLAKCRKCRSVGLLG